MKTTTLVFVMAFACVGSTAQTISTKMQEVKRIIEASNAIYSDLANKNDGSILTRYTADACLYPPYSAPVCGQENMVAFFKSGPQVHVVFKIQNLYGDAENFVTEESFYTMTDMNGNKIDDGRVIVIWKKTEESWKMYRDMFSSNNPVKK